MNSKDIKSTLIVLGFFIVLLLIIIIPTIIISKNKDIKENFPSYEEIEIKESDIKDVSSESYQKIKSQLESDPYFIREAMISNYNSSNYTSADLQSMLWNFIFSYSLYNRKYMTSFDQKKGTFCLRSKYVIDAFEELYNVNITKDIDYLPGYHEYVTFKNKKYCFNFGNVAKDYNNDILVLVDGISIKDNIVTTNLYLYEYYTMYTPSELSNINTLKSYISQSNYNYANNIVINNLNGKVTHKQLQFNILNNGNHFKYQILVSKMLDY